MERLKNMVIYLIVFALAFYALPLLIIDTGSAMFVLLIVIPIICVLTSLIYGFRHGFNWIFPVLVALLGIPAVFIHADESAIIYPLAYGLIALIGSLVGSLISRMTKSLNHKDLNNN